MRYAYIKNSNAVDQVERLYAASNNGPSSFPDAFIYNFLQIFKGQLAVVISKTYFKKYYKKDNIEARI